LSIFRDDPFFDVRHVDYSKIHVGGCEKRGIATKPYIHKRYRVSARTIFYA
jgi:hypothetical protein